MHKGMDLMLRLVKAVGGFLYRLPGNLWFFIRNPDELKQKWADIKHMAQEEVNHYWVGFKVRCTGIDCVVLNLC